MTTTRDAARQLIGRHFAPVPIPHKEKGPTIRKWQQLRIDFESAATYFNGQPQNIGIILGDASGGLADVDLDALEAVELAPYFLPPTEAIFGRAGKPQSHWLYRVPGFKKVPFQAGAADGMIVEVRSNGCQTVVPPSVHPSGEPITWHCEGEPAEITQDALVGAARKLALAALLVRHFPAKGARNDTALAIAGTLLRAGWREAEAEHFIEVR